MPIHIERTTLIQCYQGLFYINIGVKPTNRINLAGFDPCFFFLEVQIGLKSRENDSFAFDSVAQLHDDPTITRKVAQLHG